MAYVDLNPVRAKMAKIPETSRHTSIKKRCEKAQISKQPNRASQQEKSLYPFSGHPRKNQPEGIQMRLSDYIKLVDTTGRVIREDKRGHISASAQPILKRLNIDETRWLQMACKFEECFASFVGSEPRIRMICEQLEYQRPSGLAAGKRMFH